MKMKIKFLIVAIAICSFANAQNIQGGGWHSLAVCNNQTVRSWGYNNHGQLGNGTNNNSVVPVQVNGLTGVTAIAASEYHSLALKNDGTVWAWGRNNYGQLGNGNNISSDIPIPVNNLTGITAISAGHEFSIALKNDGTVWAWGRNYWGQLGNGNNRDTNIAVQVVSLTNVIAISCSEVHSLALKNDGTIWGWGYNAQGRLGTGHFNNTNVPLQATILIDGDIVAISAGGSHSLALKNDGTVWAFGQNYYGQLGLGTSTMSSLYPVQVNSINGIVAISASDLHSVALKNDGTVWAWGMNLQGQIGNGTNRDTNVAVQVSSLTNVVAIATGHRFSFALKNDGSVWAWGMNNYGQLATGTSIYSVNTPVQTVGICQLFMEINENSLVDNFSSVFPNPFSYSTTLNSTYPVRNATLTVYNCIGQIVKKVTNISEQSITINRDNLPAGLYFIHLTEDNKIISINKAIITND